MRKEPRILLARRWSAAILDPFPQYRPERFKAQAASQGTEMEPRINRPCVLIVDDVLAVRTAYRVHLQRSGFDVVEAANGVEALLRVRRAVPDVILMDLSLPLMDGWEATRLLKADRRTAAIPIVALTGLTCTGLAAPHRGSQAC